MQVYNKILEFAKKGKSAVLVTIVDKKGHGPQDLAAKMLVDKNGKTFGTIGGGSIEKIATEQAKKIFKAKTNETKEYLLDDNEKIVDQLPTGMKCGGSFTILYEYLSSKPKVFVIGAGHIGKSLNYFFKKLDFSVTFIDDREEYLKKIDKAETYLTKDYIDVFDNVEIPENSYFIITSYSHKIDFNFLQELISRDVNAKYIGTIASKVKAKSFLEDLKKEFPEENLKNLYTPIGLKIGGRSPEDIAISIISEIQAVKFNKKGNKHFSLNH